MKNKFENPSGEKSSKEKQWSEIADRIEKITDKLGMPIDAGVRESIIALRAFGINTDASCEGHSERALPAPWISFSSKENGVLREKLKEVRNEGNKDEERKISQIMRKNSILEQGKLILLLDEFYRDRIVPYDVRLIITPIRGNTLESQGADLLEIETDESKRQQKSSEYKEEMKAFTDFLKRKYLV